MNTSVTDLLMMKGTHLDVKLINYLIHLISLG